MSMKFHGTIDELKKLVASSSIPGEWTDEGSGKHSFRSKAGGVLNWWESKGTLQYQGNGVGRTALEASVARILNKTTLSPPPAEVALCRTNHIFIVHGHDTEARDQLELILRRLGLEPFILMNSSGGGMTIIEALEGQIGKDHSADFGIALLTPDDLGYAKTDGATKAEPRARQNVILETGMLLSSLTRSRMALIVKGHLEIPSDLEGIIRLGYNDHVREIVPKLCQRLREANFEFDARTISAASA